MSLYELFKKQDNFSAEAIKNYSGNLHPFAKELIQLCTDFKSTRESLIASRKPTGSTNGLFSKDVKSLVKKHLNLTISEFDIIADSSISAYAYIPDINKDNPMFKLMSRWMTNEDAGSILASRDNAVGWCDNNKVVLGEDFSEVKCRLGLHSGAVDQLSGGELAFIICHEIGHLWSAFEFIAVGVFRNVALLAAAQDIKKDWDNVNKTTLKSVIDNNGNIDVEITTVDQLDKQLCAIISKNLKESCDLTKSSYDNTAAESYADQFATRLGLGEYANTGLLKLYLSSGMAVKKGSFKATFYKIISIVIEVLIVGFSIIKLGIIAGVIFSGLLLFAIAYDQIEYVYDKFEDRVHRIKNELIAKLKSTEDNTERKILLAQIEDMSDVISIYKDTDKSGLMSQAMKILVPYFRNNINNKQLQQSYERLINNELYVVGNKFNNLRT